MKLEIPNHLFNNPKNTKLITVNIIPRIRKAVHFMLKPNSPLIYDIVDFTVPE